MKDAKEAKKYPEICREAFWQKVFQAEVEFGILDFWEDYNRWWWRQYGNDPIWGNYYDNDQDVLLAKRIIL
jgi:hypothetical protein